MVIKWGELVGKDFDSIKKVVAILPIGSVERHGDHLPLGTDTIVPQWIAERVAERIEGAVLMPPIYYGSCKALSKYLSTIDVKSDVLKDYVAEVMKSVFRNGFKLLVIINGHGGNTLPLSMAARDVTYEVGGTMLIINWWTHVAQDVRKELFTAVGHGGDDETSAVLAVVPNLVKMEYAVPNPRPYLSIKGRLYSKVIDEKIFVLPLNGNPRLASAEKGRKFLDAVVKEIVDVINEVLKQLM